MSKKNSKGLILLDPNTKKITEPIEDIRAFTSERELNRHFMDLVNKEVQARQLLNKGKTPQFTNNEILKNACSVFKIKKLRLKNHEQVIALICLWCSTQTIQLGFGNRSIWKSILH